MNSYIVRIYRQGHSRQNFVGTVEKAGEDGKKAFTNLDELWEILHHRNCPEKGQLEGQKRK